VPLWVFCASINVSNGSHQYCAWGDNRDKVTNFMYPNGRADSDVFFAKQ
jgi:hypothetical protein